MSSIHDAIIKQTADDMARSIDFEILAGFLEEIGWTKLKINYIPNIEQSWVNVINWADVNLIDEYKEHNGTWIIKDSADATLFCLKWGLIN